MFSETDRYSFSSGWLTWLSFPCPAGPTATRARVLAGRCDVASSRRSRPRSRSPREPERITRGKRRGSGRCFSSPTGREICLACVEGRSQRKGRTRGVGRPGKGPEESADHGARVGAGPTPERHGSTRGHRRATWATSNFCSPH